MICPVCNFEADNKFKFCPSCGTKPETDCACGAIIKANSAFCPECGERNANSTVKPAKVLQRSDNTYLIPNDAKIHKIDDAKTASFSTS